MCLEATGIRFGGASDWEIMKAGKFIDHLRNKNRGKPSMKGRDQLGVFRKEVGPAQINSTSPAVVGAMSQVTNEETIGPTRRTMGRGETMQAYDVSLPPNSVGIQATDPLGGLNPNKHTAISFKSKGTDGGDISRRECNLIADQLAKISLSWKLPLQVFEVPPDSVVMTIQQDKAV
ncbi:hypothetical protein J1N35_044777 [Gossypium stocksii]|uniref:Uncharacterized protein n=1 Tax=Gossypium stocksii TaxID=47602 RepID=A0A9D3ZGQ7_9ROSI|nr:hypothetical protein J1N35_044777 [Gossypium stocksii]